MNHVVIDWSTGHWILTPKKNNRRVKRRFLVSFRSVRSWLWSELMLEWATQEICEVRPQWPWDSPGPLGDELNAHPRTLLERVRGTPTLRYTGVCIRADALVASALQESAGEAKQQQQLRNQRSLTVKCFVLTVKFTVKCVVLQINAL